MTMFLIGEFETIYLYSCTTYSLVVTQFNDTQLLSVHFFCTIKETSKVCPTHGVECHGEFEDTQTSDSVSLGRVGEQPFLGVFRQSVTVGGDRLRCRLSMVIRSSSHIMSLHAFFRVPYLKSKNGPLVGLSPSVRPSHLIFSLTIKLSIYFLKQ